jgi:hypothetical protein
MSGRAPPANGPDGGSGGTRFVELAGRGGRLPADNIGIGIYGGEGCRGKRKVVCYPAGGGGQAALLPMPAAAGRLPAYPGPSQSPSPYLLITRPPASADGRRTLSHPITDKFTYHRVRVVILNPPIQLVLILSPPGLNENVDTVLLATHQHLPTNRTSKISTL